ncbi:MAG: hypothetical protein ACHQSE_02520, partial [Gemmatimonadales bacterium]
MKEPETLLISGADVRALLPMTSMHSLMGSNARTSAPEISRVSASFMERKLSSDALRWKSYVLHDNSQE